GHLVDLGCAADHDAGVVAHLRELSGAAALCGRRTNASPRGGAGHLRIRGRAHRLHVDPLVSHPASFTSHGRRRELWPRSSHAARVLLESAGVYLRRNRSDGAAISAAGVGGTRGSHTRSRSAARRRTMTGPVALKAAYIVTWVVLLGYLGSLLRRFRRVREEMKDLKRSS